MTFFEDDIGGLIVEGQDLFSDKVEVPAYSLELSAGSSDCEADANFISDALELPTQPELPQSGPMITISKSELAFETSLHGVQSLTLEVKNESDQAAYCTWLPVDDENARIFDFNNQEFTILPSQTHTCTFTFHPNQSGVTPKCR